MSLSSSLKKNFIYNELYQILAIIIPLITSPYVTRVVGAEQLGVYSFTQSYANYFVLFVLLGVNNYGNREIARARDNRDHVNKVFSEIFSLQAIMLVIVLAVYALVTPLFAKDSISIYWLQILMVLAAGFNINWCCFGLEKFRLTVIRNSVIKILSAVLIFALVHSPNDLWIYTLILAGSTLLSQVVIWPFILKELTFVRPSFKDIIKHLKPNLMLFLPVLAVSMYNIMDKLMLGIIDTNSEIAFYNYAGKLTEIPETFITALGTVMLPRAANMISKGKEKETKYLLRQSMQFVMCLSIGGAFGLCAIANDLVPWYYGNAFMRCALFTMWLSPVVVLTSWNNVIRTQFVIPKGLDKLYLITVSSGAIVNLILNAIFIRIYHGIGAVIATLIAQTVVCVVQFILTKKYLDYKVYIKDSWAFLFAGALMMTAVKIISRAVTFRPLVKILFEVVIGVCIYGACSYVYLIKMKKDTGFVQSLFGMLSRRKKNGA